MGEIVDPRIAAAAKAWLEPSERASFDMERFRKSYPHAAIERALAAADAVDPMRAEVHRQDRLIAALRRDAEIMEKGKAFNALLRSHGDLQEALQQAEHEIRLLAEHTDDYTAEGLRIRLIDEADKLAAAGGLGGVRP